MNIGWIGLGSIGLPMAVALLKSGNKVRAHSRRPHEHQVIVENGGALVNTPAETLNDITALGINVFSEDQLNEIIAGKDGIIEDIPKGTIVFIHSTVSPACIKEFADQRKDVHWLDCAFSGTAKDVENGNLTLMVGGNENILNDFKSTLAAYCKHIHYIGGTGAGLSLKIINNALFAANVQLALDGLNAATQSGIDVNLAGKVLSQSSGGSYALNALMSGANPFEFATQLHKYLDKDVAVARNAAISSHINLGKIAGVTSVYGKP